ncbi:TIGR03089 family protein [Pseudarthrobacter sp. J1763]|uniref:TIGR03089 family protein n=1 Tax=Pseudarthrobacter sp. J1763 TaxID=3420445 RepID=UPI003D2BF31D
MGHPYRDLLTALRSVDATSPRLTWYGPDFERVELSGRVLDNWVAKTANFLQDEVDVEPGTKVLVNMPAHWKSIVVAFAALACDAELYLGPNDSALDSEVVFGNTIQQLSGADASSPVMVGVALGALAMRFDGDLPPGAVDYNAEVRSHADVFMPYNDSPESTHQARLNTAKQSYSAQESVKDFAQETPQGARVLVSASAGLEDLLASCLGAWLAGGSIVVVHNDEAATDRLRSSERITWTQLPG